MEINYYSKLERESLRSNYSKNDLLNENYLLDSFKSLKIYYAPFDFVNKNASVIIVGITPGWTQMQESFKIALGEIKKLNSETDVLKKVKSQSSFSGSMRVNLIKMLDELELNKKLNLPTCEDLFSIDSELLHSTSVLRYPVFKDNKNYTGSSPSPIKSQFLWNMIEKMLVPELNNFENKLIIPLGKNVNDVLVKLKAENKIKSNLILEGFPHPSGANGHRATQFNLNKIAMKKDIEKWVY